MAIPAEQWQRLYDLPGSPMNGRSSLGGFLFGDNSARDQAGAEENTRIQGGDYLRGYAGQQMEGAQGRRPASMRGVDVNGQFRDAQQGLLGNLQRVMSGQEAGAGELATQRMGQQARSSIFAGNAMARGGNAGIAARAAARSLGDLGVNTAGQAREAALQDQAAARGLYGQVAAAGRGQDIDQAGLAQRAREMNLNATMQQRGINDAYGMGMFDRYFNVGDAELRARMARMQAMYAQPEDRGLFGDITQMGGAALTAFLGRPPSPGGGGGGGGGNPKYG